MSDDDTLTMWVIYDRPSDEHLYRYVARMFAIRAGESTPTPNVLKSEHIEVLRNYMHAKQLTCLARHPDDEPHIVETWV